MDTLHGPTDQQHAPWCAPDQHIHDTDENTGICYSRQLHLDFGDRGPHEDAVDQASLFLQRHQGRTTLTVLAGFGMELDPDQIRSMAMALLHVDATLRGDLDLAAYYQAEAENGTVCAR